MYARLPGIGANKRKTPETEEEKQKRLSLANARMNDFVLPLSESFTHLVQDPKTLCDKHHFVQLLLDMPHEPLFEPQFYQLPDESLVVYVPGFVKSAEEKALMNDLETLDLSQFLFGRPVRRKFTYLDDNAPSTPILHAVPQQPPPPPSPQFYKRGKNAGKPKPPPRPKKPKQRFPPALRALAQRLQPFAGLELSRALINLYRRHRFITKKGEWTQGAGKDNIPPHRDSESIFGKDRAIISVSLGQRRRFYIQHEATGKILAFDLGGGDLLIMTPPANRHCIHWIPNEPNREITQDRWNITFRSLLPEHS